MTYLNKREGVFGNVQVQVNYLETRPNITYLDKSSLYQPGQGIFVLCSVPVLPR